MPQVTREIKRRINSITSTKKITRAMELVAANKMRKATGQVLASRPYADRAWEMLQNLARQGASIRSHNAVKRKEDEQDAFEGVVRASEGDLHPLLESLPEGKRTILILITSNRGLCGNFNTNVVNLALDYIEFYQKHKVTVEVISLGKRGSVAVVRSAFNIKAEFEKLDVTSNIQEINALAKFAIDEYLKGIYGKIMVAYTDFISTLVQKPRIKQILPLTGEDEYLGRIQTPAPEQSSVRGTAHSQRTQTQDEVEKERLNASWQRLNAVTEYLFEPSPKEVLDDLLPRLVEVQIYQAILESDASEHSSRMVAMKNATEAAGDMIYDQTLAFNQARQTAITQEIAEIATAKVVIER